MKPWKENEIHLQLCFPLNGTEPEWFEITYAGRIKSFSDDKFYKMPEGLKFSYEAGKRRTLLKRKDDGYVYLIEFNLRMMVMFT